MTIASPGIERHATELVRWPLLAWLLPLLPLLILAASALVPAQRQLVAVDPAAPVLSGPFTLRGGPLGSPSIRLRTDLPPDSSMGLAVDLLDAGGTAVLQLDKEGWRETGTWVEDGQSGTWDESDTVVALDLRPRTSGSYRLRLTLEDLRDNTGRPLQAPLVVRLRVRNHSVDAPLLLFTAVVGTGMVAILHASIYRGWRTRRVVRLEDCRVGLRLWAGGPGLLRLRIRARWERPSSDTAPLAGLPQTRFELVVSDALGRPRLEQRRWLAPRRYSSDGDHWLTLAETIDLRVPDSQNLRVRAVVSERLDDGDEPWEIEWLELVLEDGVRTAVPVAALPLAPAREAA